MTNKQNVNIKGSKDGLLFLLNDDCSFEEIIEELKDKLENSHQGILTGPLMKVIIKSGFRKLTQNQQEALRSAFKAKGNLVIHSIENEVDTFKDKLKDQVKVTNGIIRSGQVFHYDGNVLLVGDVNPGGKISATGDIYILGTLKGTAHAGIDGNEKATIVASIMNPTQLRIAGFMHSRSEKNEVKKNEHEIAFIKDNQIHISQFKHFSMLRKAFGTFI